MSVQGETAALQRAGGFGRWLELLADRQFKYLLVLPTVLVLLAITVFPAIYTLVVSFQNITLMAEDTSFHGLMNYERLMQDGRFWGALGHTLVFTAAALALQLGLGLLMALLFMEDLPGRPVWLSLLVLPTVISPIVAGSTWRILYDNQYGPINQILSWITGEPTTILWTVTRGYVYPAILLAEVWQWTPFMFLLLLAALSNVDRAQIEAAEIDGAGYWRTFWSVVFPAIQPIVAIAVLIRGLDLFRIFDKVWILTQGGPGTRTEMISIYMYKLGFQQFETSFTAAIAFIIIVLLTVAVIFALRRMQVT